MIPQDKQLHLLAGSQAASLGLLVGEPWVLGLCLLLAAFKEARDELWYDGGDWQDFLATVAGGLFTHALVLGLRSLT